jgi:hypothetical protein
MSDIEYDVLPPPSEEFAPVINTIKEMSIVEMIRIYRETRDDLTAERKAFKQREANVKDLLSRISMALREKGDALGVDSFSTPAGTAYRNVKQFYRVGNWEKIRAFIEQTGNWQMLEKRVAKLATKEIHEALGEVPPGIDYSAEVEFMVRKN